MNDGVSGAERIASYYPGFIRDVYDFQVLFHTLGLQSDSMRASMAEVLDSGFASSVSGRLLEKLEELLGINAPAGQTERDRRAKICSLIRGYGHIGAPEIKNIAATFTDAPCSVGFADGMVTVSIVMDGDDSFNAADCAGTIRERLPAHLPLTLRTEDNIRCGVYVGPEIRAYEVYNVN